MANNINPINFGITGNYLKREAKEETVKANQEQVKEAPKQNKQLAANDVLGFLAAQNSDIMPTKVQKTVDVSKYVTPEQEARIAGFMKGFEADYDAAYSTAKNEFADMSDKAAGEVALAYINASYK